MKILGLRSLEQHSVSGSSSVQKLSQLVAEKLVKYLEQEGGSCNFIITMTRACKDMTCTAIG